MSVVASFGETNPGRKRRRNEDAFVCEPPIFAVADGMGGAQAGEVASSLAATALSGALAGHERVAASEAEQTVAELIHEANRRVHQRATSDATASGMGTTMTVALVGTGDTVTIGHVGDSRAYLLRDGSLEQLTDDHSLVAELVRRGEISPAEAAVHPQRSVITRALGTEPDVEVDVFSLQAKRDDLFLLCSDGLSTMVDAETIADVVERTRTDLQAATRELIRAANNAGGDDNITVVLFEIGEEPGLALLEPEEADTLHPEDGVPVLVLASEPSAEPPADSPDEPPADLADGDTVVLTADAVRAAVAAAEPERELVPLWRLLFATLLIVALAAAVVALAVWGLAR